MGYLNPLLAYGFDGLAARCRAAGVAGFIVPDLPFEESAGFEQALDAQGMALMRMVTPVTPEAPGAGLCRQPGLRLRRDDDRHDGQDRLPCRRDC